MCDKWSTSKIKSFFLLKSILGIIFNFCAFHNSLFRWFLRLSAFSPQGDFWDCLIFHLDKSLLSQAISYTKLQDYQLSLRGRKNINKEFFKLSTYYYLLLAAEKGIKEGLPLSHSIGTQPEKPLSNPVRRITFALPL